MIPAIAIPSGPHSYRTHTHTALKSQRPSARPPVTWLYGISVLGCSAAVVVTFRTSSIVLRAWLQFSHSAVLWLDTGATSSYGLL